VAGSSLQEIGVFCGNKRPPMLMSDGVKLDVTFISRSSASSTSSAAARPHPGRGFSATFHFVTGKKSLSFISIFVNFF